MSMEWIRRNYGVPAKRGGRVAFFGVQGTITSASHYLRVRMDDGHRVLLHPTWRVHYLDPAGAATVHPTGTAQAEPQPEGPIMATSTTTKRNVRNVHQHTTTGAQRHRSRVLSTMVDGNGVHFTIRDGRTGEQSEISLALGDGADLTAFLRTALHG